MLTTNAYPGMRVLILTDDCCGSDHRGPFPMKGVIKVVNDPECFEVHNCGGDFWYNCNECLVEDNEE